ncbi:MAG: glycosyltransferase [Solirubrobacterales bacterium]
MRKVALAHDYLLVMRGAERSFAAIADCWPDAPIYTTLYDEEGTDGRFAGRRVVSSPLQRLPMRQRGFRALLPLMPAAVRRLPVGDADVVISSSSAFAHGVRPKEGAAHVCYCYTPFRYAWHERDTALAEVSPLLRPALRMTLSRIRKWDLAASRRVSHYVAISRLVQERIADLYDRSSTVIHPPVEVDRFAPGEPGDAFVFVGELVAHKRVDVVLEAARRARKRLRVVGDGPELERWRARFPDAEFLGRVADPDLPGILAEARALLVPNVEEFGIAAVEAQAAGRPVVAVAAGGVLETVVDGETGILLERADADEFAEVLSEVDFDRFDPDTLARHASSFSTASFKQRFTAEVERARGGPATAV